MTLETPTRTGESTTLRILEAVADERDVDPVALNPPLATVVDPDALDALVDSADDGVSISFSYAGCRVAVTEDDVDVTEHVPLGAEPTDRR